MRDNGRPWLRGPVKAAPPQRKAAMHRRTPKEPGSAHTSSNGPTTRAPGQSRTVSMLPECPQG